MPMATLARWAKSSTTKHFTLYAISRGVPTMHFAGADPRMAAIDAVRFPGWPVGDKPLVHFDSETSPGVAIVHHSKDDQPLSGLIEGLRRDVEVLKAKVADVEVLKAKVAELNVTYVKDNMALIQLSVLRLIGSHYVKDAKKKTASEIAEEIKRQFLDPDAGYQPKTSLEALAMSPSALRKLTSAKVRRRRNNRAHLEKSEYRLLSSTLRLERAECEMHDSAGYAGVATDLVRLVLFHMGPLAGARAMKSLRKTHREYRVPDWQVKRHALFL